MYKPLSKVLVATAMLIAFVGQLLAYTAMSCEMSTDSHQSHMNMDHSSMNHHEGMNHSEMDTSNNVHSEDCCNVDCVCPANSCTSTTVLNSNVDSTDIQFSGEAVIIIQSKHPSSISTSLFRPPIFA